MADVAQSATAARRADPAFWYIWSATVVSGLGDGIWFAGLPLFAAVFTRDPLAVALITVAGQLPWVCVGPFAGLVIDRSQRLRVLWICDLARAGIMGGLAAVIAIGRADLASLVVTAFLLSSLESVADNLSQVIIPEVAGSRSLDTANSLLFGGQMVTTEFIGAPLAAFLLAAAHALPFGVDAVTFVMSAVLILALAQRRPAIGFVDGGGHDRRSVAADMLASLRWVARDRALRSLCLLMGALNFAVVSVLGIAVLYALDVLHVSGKAYGLLLSLVAAGGVLGFVVAPAVTARIGKRRTLLLAFALCPLPLVIGGVTSQALVAAPALLLVGTGTSLGSVVSTTLRQVLIPSEVYGRVNSAFRLFVNGLAPLGAFAGGLIAQQYSLRMPFFIAAGVTAAMVVSGPWLLRALPARTE